MSKLTEILEAHLPKEKVYITNNTNAYEIPYNACLAEVKKALPDIEKAIVEEIKHISSGVNKENLTDFGRGYITFSQELLTSLTK